MNFRERKGAGFQLYLYLTPSSQVIVIPTKTKIIIVDLAIIENI